MSTTHRCIHIPRRGFLALVAGCTLGSPLTGATSSGNYDRLILNTAFASPISTPDGGGFFDRLMRELFASLNHVVAIQSPPAERALMLANAGIDDGDGPRIPGLDTEWNYPHLIRIPEALLEVEFCAFTLDSAIRVSNWSGLTGYQVGIVTGWKILEQQLEAHGGVVKVKDPESLFLLLKNRRAEVVVIDRYSGAETARHLGIECIRLLRPPLAVMPMYLYLHSSHAALAIRAADELQAMKRDGRYQQIYSETLAYVDKQYPSVSN